MRSLKLCLLVFLTSCMLDTINAQFKDVCDGKAVDYDCKDVHKPEDEFAWTVATSFDNRKPVPGGDFVEIDMHRALYIEGHTVDITGVKFESKNNFENCQLYFFQRNVEFVSMKTLPSSLTFDANKKIVLAVTDPNCRLYAKITATMKKANLYHIFLRNLKTELLPVSVRAVFDKKVLAKTKTDKIPKHGHLIYSQKKGIKEGNVAQDVKGSNNFFAPINNNNRQQCYHLCKLGSLFVYKVNKDLTTFANKFQMKKKCEWMTINLYEGNSAEISLRHGFAKLPNELKVYPMDFEAISSPLSDDGTYYEVTVMYTNEIVEVVTNGDDKVKRQMVITNSHGRAIRSYAVHGNAETISFAFSHDDCLTANIGSAFVKPNKQFEPSEFEFAPVMNLAHKVSVEPQLNSYGYMQDGKDNTPYGDPLPKDEDYIGIDAEPAVVVIYEAPEKQTTKAQVTFNPGDTAAPVEANTPQSMDPEQVKQMEEIRKAEAAYEELKKRISEGVYYCYWGIPGGFAAGSFGTFIICNIILFFFKRSVLTFWYKAMYKRYGSDTTMGAGTTMGKTVGGETIGGGTTMGGTTAGGETTVGSTTAA